MDKFRWALVKKIETMAVDLGMDFWEVVSAAKEYCSQVEGE